MNEPMRQIDEDSGEKPRLSEAQQESQRIKLRRGMDERHSDADDSPGDHDAREPATRAPFFDDDRTRNFEQEVTGEENSGTEAEHAIVEAQLPRHLERGRGNIRAVEEGDDVEDREVRQQAGGNGK